jgi:EAL domain-containing protein (putative c-di-GMP-specific phosphodiesterase class I)
MDTQVSNRLEMLINLRRALDQQEFKLYYQPKLSLKDGSVIGAEALIRWQSPEQGMVPPDRFIPFAEETGLILPIGEWVLRTACHQNKRWQQAGLPRFRWRSTFRRASSTRACRSSSPMCWQSGLAASCLELELPRTWS